MKPKPTINANDAIGEEALRLLTESGTVVTGVALGDMHAAKKARKARLKEVLTIIWNGYEQGQTFNGQPTKENWAMNFAKVSIRHIQHQVFGRKRREANTGSRTFTAKPGDRIKWTDGRVWVFGHTGANPNLRLDAVQPGRKEPKKAKRLTLRQTYTVLEAIRKQLDKELGKYGHQRTAEGADKYLDAILALNNAAKKPQYSPWRTAKKHAEERVQFFATEEQMKTITHLASDDEPGTTWTRCMRDNVALTIDLNAVQCEECRKNYETHKRLDAMRPVHAAGNIIDPNNARRVRCLRGGSNPKITSNRAEVTCDNCIAGLDHDEELSRLPDFYKTVPEGATKKETDHLWQVYLQARRQQTAAEPTLTVVIADDCPTETEEVV